jgi:hypothetical protein
MGQDAGAPGQRRQRCPQAEYPLIPERLTLTFRNIKRTYVQFNRRWSRRISSGCFVFSFA